MILDLNLGLDEILLKIILPLFFNILSFSICWT